ncbi:class I SAM-dependent methyltransferase [Aquimarina gracilis]|uniref:Class I SAM-dependent methyltransferase n=1 Tax=Aquimarina gracilis TaxID=874422 RepID=A0ABU5ZQU3_9FLAO|nr:class I SAM-dependent methyltransferase [Aquimarina gracilis]MEB3344412.1 class I SAM-dependent methyltransferase [Aquimarina gracilis]
MQCSLCGSETYLFSEVKGRKFFKCTECSGILLHSSHFLSPEQEKERYLLHQNDVNDSGYQNFVSPIVKAIFNRYDSSHIGLDFGSGSGPVITSLLTNKEYNIRTYDPYFAPNNKALNSRYDYVICCEVMEHFYIPSKEFELLFSLLKPNGTLYCKTNLYYNTIDFDSWWYKNDPTHVFFYSPDSLHWIKNRLGFESLTIEKDLITFRK